ncbi:MAG: hypothetical protein IJ202_09725 [Bacteroidales bacterium]|nr:hypothetical protein [Bacteroidales bacterium]MBQ9711416.1 hypothetical protein [Bacteroidales bacterium]
MEGLIILLLSLCLAVGVSVLVAVLMLLRLWRSSSTIPFPSKEDLSLQPDSIIRAASKPLSPQERKYLLLFLQGKSTEEIASTMHVDPSSVYTMKYRIRKKYPENYQLPF